VLDDSLDTPDGVQQYVLGVGRWIAAQGHDVHYLVGHTTRSDVAHVHSLSRNVKVRFNQNRMSIPLPASRKAIRAVLQREQFDVLHVQMPYSPMLAARVIQAAGNHTAVVGTFHVAPHSKLVHMANAWLRLLVRSSLKRFDAIMPVSMVARDFARATFGIDGEVVPNTVDLAPFLQAKAFPKYSDVPTIVFLGRLVERKGCQHLLRAVAHLQETGKLDSKTKILICGAGPLEASLKQYVAAHNLGGSVTFTGFLSEADKPRYLASADVVVYPSTGGESFGIVLLEAMAAARGVVLAGDNPGYASVMADHTAALFDPHDEKQVAELLSQWLHDAAARHRSRAWQQQYVRQFDVPQVGQRILTVYTKALHKRQA